MIRRNSRYFMFFLFLGMYTKSFSSQLGERTLERSQEVGQQEIKKNILEKQQELEQQRVAKSEAEKELRDAQGQEKEAQQKIDDLGIIGQFTKSFWTGLGLGSTSLDTFVQEKTEAQDKQKRAQEKINEAQQRIEQLTKDMESLSQEYIPVTSTEALDVLKNQLDQSLKNKNFATFNDTLQSIVAQEKNVEDKFSQISNAIDLIAKEYPNDLTAQVKALNALELTFIEMLAKNSSDPAYSDIKKKIEKARELIQIRIDKNSTWVQALQKGDTYNFGVQLRKALLQEKTDVGKRVLLRDAFDEVSKTFASGSQKWLNALEDVLSAAERVPTEKEDVDLNEELMVKAVDLVNTIVEVGSPLWDDALNYLWLIDNNGVVQERISQYLAKEEATLKTVNLDDLLKNNKLADYQIGLHDALSAQEEQGKLVIFENQFVAVVGRYDTQSYNEQMQALSILAEAFDPQKYTAQDKAILLHKKIVGRLDVIRDRLTEGYETLSDALQGAPHDWARVKILDEEMFTASQLQRDVKDSSGKTDDTARYNDQKSVLESLQKILSPNTYSGELFDSYRQDIEHRLEEISTFNPQVPDSPTHLEVELLLWQLLPADQIIVLKQKYNDFVDQIKNAVAKDDAVGVSVAQEGLEEIKEIVQKYGLEKIEDGFAKNIDSTIESAKNILTGVKTVALSEQEMSILKKLLETGSISVEELLLLGPAFAKKAISYAVTILSPENVNKANVYGGYLTKAPDIAKKIAGYVETINNLLSYADTWWVKTLLSGPKIGTQIASSLVKKVISPILGKEMITNIETWFSKGSETTKKIFEFAGSKEFQEIAQTVRVGGNVVQTISSLLERLSKGISDAAPQYIKNLPEKEVISSYKASRSLSRRLQQLGALEPDLTSEKNVSVKKGFFARIQEKVSLFVADIKQWIQSKFVGDSGIVSLEKKFAAAQKAYKESPTDVYGKNLVAAAQKLSDAYYQVMGTVAGFKDLSTLWDSVVLNSDVADALDKGEVAIEVLDQAAVALMQAKAYKAAFNNAMGELSAFVGPLAKGTNLEDIYQQQLNQLVMRDYITDLSMYRKNINDLTKSFERYSAQLEEASDKKNPVQTPSNQEQTDILGGGGSF